jgi:hypothetical protein
VRSELVTVNMVHTPSIWLTLLAKCLKTFIESIAQDLFLSFAIAECGAIFQNKHIARATGRIMAWRAAMDR